jgi:hypothetical protein
MKSCSCTTLSLCTRTNDHIKICVTNSIIKVIGNRKSPWQYIYCKTNNFPISSKIKYVQETSPMDRTGNYVQRRQSHSLQTHTFGTALAWKFKALISVLDLGRPSPLVRHWPLAAVFVNAELVNVDIFLR